MRECPREALGSCAACSCSRGVPGKGRAVRRKGLAEMEEGRLCLHAYNAGLGDVCQHLGNTSQHPAGAQYVGRLLGRFNAVLRSHHATCVPKQRPRCSCRLGDLPCLHGQNHEVDKPGALRDRLLDAAVDLGRTRRRLHGGRSAAPDGVDVQSKTPLPDCRAMRPSGDEHDLGHLAATLKQARPQPTSHTSDSVQSYSRRRSCHL
mmetsp:Transcript_33966/g.87816  ORF Transcript_33966/g.87816 Transcript_33966/m.87816 type:complete len:205 (+) Transcript_33966:523-1137(+)